jgi:uncharacterized membrane protein YvbJ
MAYQCHKCGFKAEKAADLAVHEQTHSQLKAQEPKNKDNKNRRNIAIWLILMLVLFAIIWFFFFRKI